MYDNKATYVINRHYVCTRVLLIFHCHGCLFPIIYEMDGFFEITNPVFIIHVYNSGAAELVGQVRHLPDHFLNLSAIFIHNYSCKILFNTFFATWQTLNKCYL